MYLLLSWSEKGKNNVMVKTNSAPLYHCLYTSYEVSAEVSEQLEVSCCDTPVALSQHFQILLNDKRTILRWHLLDDCYPSFCRSWTCCTGELCPPPLECSPCAEVLKQTGFTTTQTCCNPRWAGARSHSRVTEGWKAWFGIKSNFKHLKCSV